MRRKLGDPRGETLVEVLASILICSLSVLLLFGAVGASVSIDLTAQAADGQYYEDLSKAERQYASDSIPPSVAAVTVTGAEAVALDPARVLFYGDKDRLLSYAMPAAGGGP
nr:hypothetical protein [uncultured Oscillibacter sp.]